MAQVVKVSRKAVKSARYKATKKTALAPRQVDYVSATRGERMLDKQSRKYLNMSGKEFKTRFVRGEPIEGDESAIIRVSMLLPFAERSENGRR